MNPLFRIRFRLTTLLLAALLGAQCVWLLIPQLSSHINRLPNDPSSAAAAARYREAAARAASVGAIRGDLWANFAFTYAGLLWTGAGAPNGLARDLASARASLERSLKEAPHNSAAWLLLAGLASRYPSTGLDAVKLLKTSYYTGPSEQDLLPLRLQLATHSDFTNDLEMRQFITRDLRFLLGRQKKLVLRAVYDAASPDGKHSIEQTILEIEPSALSWLSSTQQHELPN